jgi:uncharacterized membrane protein
MNSSMNMNDKNVGRMERIVSGLVGPWLLGFGLRRRSLAGLAIASGGAMLLHRGITGRCMVYERLGISTTDEAVFRGVDVRRTVTIMASPQDLYARWRKLENLPRILGHLESVQEESDGATSHWTARIGTMTAQWDAELVIEEPGSRLAWQTMPDSDWMHAGDITFRPAPGGRGTEMTVHLRVAPRAGRMLLRVAPFLRGLTRITLGNELRRFKQLVETGEIATNATRPEKQRQPPRDERRIPPSEAAGAREEVQA